MKVLYLCNFDISGYSGKDRATRQKLEALSKQVEHLTIVSAKYKKMKFIELFVLELKASYLLIKHKPDVLISRGFVGYFVQKLAKYKKIRTVREVHADMLSEIKQTNKAWIIKKLLLPMAIFTQKIDNNSDMRIFNHPDLLKWYKSKFHDCINDIFVYNGFDFNSKSTLSQSEAREKFNFQNNLKYLVFTGSASYWHGIDYLVALQREFNKLNYNIQVVCGGGNISSTYDPNCELISISPLDDKGCADLIQASDFCVLPVRQSRVSPGSPLKLYDYMLHKKFIITQEMVNGYSDEVEKYGYGVNVDFNNSYFSAIKIYSFMNNLSVKPEVNINEFSWNLRIKEWIEGINKLTK